MGSKLILLLSLLVGVFLTFMCIDKDKDALLHKYKDIGESTRPVAVMPLETPPSIPEPEIEPEPEPEPKTKVPTENTAVVQELKTETEAATETNDSIDETPVANEVEKSESNVSELATPIFAYSLGENTKLSAKLSTKNKTKAMEEFILTYCPAESCTQDLSFEEQTQEAAWQDDVIKIATFLKEKNVKNGVISVGGNLLNIEGELANDADMKELNQLLEAFDNKVFKIENRTKIAPQKEQTTQEENTHTEKSLKEVEQEIAKLLKAHPILFKFNSSTITKESKSTLDNVIDTIKNYPKVALTIEGHTDAKGRASYNKRLSQQRADAVKKYLQKELKNKIEAIGYGEAKPISTNPKEKINRRVEIHLKEGA